MAHIGVRENVLTAYGNTPYKRAWGLMADLEDGALVDVAVQHAERARREGDARRRAHRLVLLAHQRELADALPHAELGDPHHLPEESHPSLPSLIQTSIQPSV
jgi:molybdenum-dependent DNA-binding transcriptional regulator ModE